MERGAVLGWYREFVQSALDSKEALTWMSVIWLLWLWSCRVMFVPVRDSGFSMTDKARDLWPADSGSPFYPSPNPFLGLYWIACY